MINYFGGFALWESLIIFSIKNSLQHSSSRERTWKKEGDGVGNQIVVPPIYGIAEQRTPFPSQWKRKDFPFTQATTNDFPWLKSFNMSPHCYVLSFTDIHVQFCSSASFLILHVTIVRRGSVEKGLDACLGVTIYWLVN